MKNIKLNFGGITKESLIRLLNECDIMINPLGEKLLKMQIISSKYRKTTNTVN